MEEWEPLEKEFIDIAAALLAAGAEVDQRTAGGYTPLMHAVATNQVELVRLLLRHGAQVHLVTDRGYTPLMQAVNENNVPMVELLLAWGAATGVNDKDNDGWTAMMRAAYRNQTEMVSLLLGYGAYRLTMDEGGWDAHSLAKFRGHDPSERVLRTDLNSAMAAYSAVN